MASWWGFLAVGFIVGWYCNRIFKEKLEHKVINFREKLEKKQKEKRKELGR